MRKIVYVLLIILHEGDDIKQGVGPVTWDRIEANRIKRSLESRGASVLIIERQVRGDMPVPHLTSELAGRERGNSPAEAGEARL